MLPALFVSLIAAVLPALLYFTLFYWADRHEREPLQLSIAAFLWGAIPAIILSVFGEIYLSVALIQSPDTVTGALLERATIAPVVEELIKGAALLGLYIWFYSEFDNVLDGLIYGVIVGLGFAMSENFLYFLGAVGTSDYSTLTTVIFLRAVLFGLNHAFYTGLTGIGFGIARNARNPWNRLFYPLLGLAAAIAVHSIHNLGISLMAYNQLSILFSIVLAVLGVMVLIFVIRLTWSSERSIFRAELEEEINYTISAEEYETLLDNWHRPLRRLNQTERAKVRRLHLSAELALHKQRLRRLGTEREPSLPEQITRIRAKLLEG